MVDLNCDLGEGGSDDEKLMPYLTSCNISCGAHAGSESEISTAIRAAKKHQVKIGAHPSYPDRENFGREILPLSMEELQNSLISQLEFFKEQLDKQQASIHHVKPHGALYNHAALDPDTANCIINAIQQVFPNAIIYTLKDGVLDQLAREQGFETWSEGFGDRNYTDELKLVSRNQPNAVMTEKEKIMHHISSMIRDKKIITESGKAVPAEIQTVCIHGDNPKALEILKFLRTNLPEFK